MANFKVNEKVVCIDASANGFSSGLIKHEIYTILQIVTPPIGEQGLVLSEIKSLHYEGSWSVFRFRKIDYEFAENLLAEISEVMKSETILN